jgi:subtilase family serine protease
VVNQGAGSAGAFDISYYVSVDGTYQAGTDLYLCKRSVTSLAPGASNPPSGTTQTSCPVPNVAAGNYYVIAITDSGGTVAESNETNNNRQASFTISGIDLVPTAMTATKSGTTTVLVSETVKNQGSSKAGSFTIRYYLSTDTTYQSGTDIALAGSSNGTGICGRTVSSLNAGSSRSVSNQPCYKPGGAVNGMNYYVIVVDDAGNTVSENNETNNTRPTGGTIRW